MISRAGSGHLAMLTFSALVAGSFALGGLIANDIAPTAVNALRFWLSAGIVGAIAYSQSGLKRAHFAAPWRFVLLASAFMLYFVTMFEGLKTAPPVSIAAVFTLTPIIAGGFGYLLLRQIMTRRMAFALLIGGIGAIWVIFRADVQAILAFDVGRGEAIYFVGVIAHALYTPMLAKLNRGEPLFAFTFGVLLAGAILLTVVGWRDLIATDWAGLRPLVWVTIGYLTIFAATTTTILLQFASLRLPSAKVMAYTYLVPSWVMLWQLALGSDWPRGLVLLGVGMTAAALLLLLRDETGGSAVSS